MAHSWNRIDPNLIPSNIKDGVSIFGVGGNFAWDNTTVLSDLSKIKVLQSWVIWELNFITNNISNTFGTWYKVLEQDTIHYYTVSSTNILEKRLFTDNTLIDSAPISVNINTTSTTMQLKKTGGYLTLWNSQSNHVQVFDISDLSSFEVDTLELVREAETDWMVVFSISNSQNNLKRIDSTGTITHTEVLPVLAVRDAWLTYGDGNLYLCYYRETGSSWDWDRVFAYNPLDLSTVSTYSNITNVELERSKVVYLWWDNFLRIWSRPWFVNTVAVAIYSLSWTTITRDVYTFITQSSTLWWSDYRRGIYVWGYFITPWLSVNYAVIDTVWWTAWFGTSSNIFDI